ncbi:MAG TPA: hypothetical protein DGK91_14140 [Clostridium sp.]|nr:hypothetical protein [Clostridium sp.]
MPTSYSEIDNMFLSDLKDDTLLSFDEDDRDVILDGLRRKAVTQFKACKKNLSDRDDEKKQFNSDLTDEEMLIIATAMRKFWLNDKIYDLKLLKQRMSTKDWKMTSQATHLLRLLDLKDKLENELSRMIVSYTLYAYPLK